MRPTERRPTVPGVKGPSPGGTGRQPSSHIPVPVRKSHGKRKKDKESPECIQVSPQPLSELLKTIRPPRDNRPFPSADKGNANRTTDFGTSTTCDAPVAKDNDGGKESFLPRKLRVSRKVSCEKAVSTESKDTQQRVKGGSSGSIINFKHDRKSEAVPNGSNKVSKKNAQQKHAGTLCDVKNIRNSNAEPDVPEDNHCRDTAELLHVESREKNLNDLAEDRCREIIIQSHPNGIANHDGSGRREIIIQSHPNGIENHDGSGRREIIIQSHPHGAEQRGDEERGTTKQCRQPKTVQKATLEVCVVKKAIPVDQENNRPTCDPRDMWEGFRSEDSEENPSDTSSTEEKCYLDNFCSAGEERSFSVEDGPLGRRDSPGVVTAMEDEVLQFGNDGEEAKIPHFQEVDTEKEALREEVSRLRLTLEEERFQLVQVTQQVEKDVHLNAVLRSDLEREKGLRLETEVRLKEALCEAERCKVELATLQNSVKAQDEANILLRAESSIAALKHDAPAYENKIRRYQNRTAALEKENVMLLNELKSLQPPMPYDPKEHEGAICRILTKKLEVLGQEKATLAEENEHQRAQYEQCLDQVANQVVQTLLVQKKLEADCKRLRSRLQEMDEENKRLTQAMHDQLRTENSHEQMGPNLFPSQEERDFQNHPPSRHSKTRSGKDPFSGGRPLDDRVRLQCQGQEFKIRNDLPGNLNTDAAYTSAKEETSKTFISWRDVSPTSQDSNNDDSQIFVVSPFGSDETRFSYSDSSEKTDTERGDPRGSAIPAPKAVNAKRESVKGSRNHSVPGGDLRNQNLDSQRHFSTRGHHLHFEDRPRDVLRAPQVPPKWQKTVVANKDLECESRRKRTNAKHGARPKSYQIIPGKGDVFTLFHASVYNASPGDLSKRPRSYYPSSGGEKENLYKSVVRRDLSAVIRSSSDGLEGDSSNASSLFSPLPESESSLSAEDGRKHKDEGYSTMSSDQQIDGNETRPEGEEEHPYQPSETTGPSTDESVTECIDGSSMSSSSDSGLGPLQYLAVSINNSDVSEDGDDPFVRKNPEFGGNSRRALVLGTHRTVANAESGAPIYLFPPHALETSSPNDRIPSNHNAVLLQPTDCPTDQHERTSSPWHAPFSRVQTTAEKATLTEPEDQWRHKAAVWSLEDSMWTLSSSTTSCSSFSRSSRECPLQKPLSPGVAPGFKFASTDSSPESDWPSGQRQVRAERKPLLDAEYCSSNSFQVAKHLLARGERRLQELRFGNNLERVSSDSVLYLKDLFRSLESSMEPGLHTVKGRMDLHILPHHPPSADSNRTSVPLHLSQATRDEGSSLRDGPESARHVAEGKPFAQQGARPEHEEDHSPTTSLSSVYSSSSCQAASDEEEMGFASVKCSRDPDLSSETDSEHDLEHKNFVEQWLQKGVCHPGPEQQTDPSGGGHDPATWRFSLLSEDTRCFSNDELRSRRPALDSCVSQTLSSSYGDLRGSWRSGNSVPFRDLPPSRVQVVKPYSHTESGSSQRGGVSPAARVAESGHANLGHQREPRAFPSAEGPPPQPSDGPVSGRQSSRGQPFGRKCGSLTDLRCCGVATRMTFSDAGSSGDECLQPAVKEFNSDFYRLCAVDSARSLLTSSRSLTTSDSSSQTEAEYILHVESDGAFHSSSSSSSDTDDSEGCFCSRLLPPACRTDRPCPQRLTPCCVQSSPTHRRGPCSKDKRSPKRKHLKIRKIPRRQEARYSFSDSAQADTPGGGPPPGGASGSPERRGSAQCPVAADGIAVEEEEEEEAGKKCVLDGAPRYIATPRKDSPLQAPASPSSGSRLKVTVNRMRRMGTRYFWRRHLWRKEKHPERGKEGCETAWVHLQADVDLTDPQARAVLLDTMMASSSSSEEEVPVENPKRRGLPGHLLSRRHRHKTPSERCPGGESAAPQGPPPWSSTEKCRSYETGCGDPDEATTERFDIVDGISTNRRDLWPTSPREKRPGDVGQRTIIPRSASFCPEVAAPSGDCAVARWDNSPATLMMTSLEGEPVDHISLSDSCAESYTSSSDNLEGP